MLFSAVGLVERMLFSEVGLVEYLAFRNKIKFGRNQRVRFGRIQRFCVGIVVVSHYFFKAAVIIDVSCS